MALIDNIQKQYKLSSVKANAKKMYEGGASEAEIDDYLSIKGTTPEEISTIKHYDNPTPGSVASKGLAVMGSMFPQMPQAGKIDPMGSMVIDPLKASQSGQEFTQHLLDPMIRPRIDAKRDFAEGQQPDIKPFVTGQPYVDPNIAQGSFDIGRKHGSDFAYETLTHPLTYTPAIGKELASGIATGTARGVGGILESTGKRLTGQALKKSQEILRPTGLLARRAAKPGRWDKAVEAFADLSSEVKNPVEWFFGTQKAKNPEQLNAFIIGGKDKAIQAKDALLASNEQMVKNPLKHLRRILNYSRTQNPYGLDSRILNKTQIARVKSAVDDAVQSIQNLDEVPLSRMEELKQQLGRKVRSIFTSDADAPLAKQADDAVRGALQHRIEDLVPQVAKLNKRIGGLTRAEKVIENFVNTSRNTTQGSSMMGELVKQVGNVVNIGFGRLPQKIMFGARMIGSQVMKSTAPRPPLGPATQSVARKMSAGKLLRKMGESFKATGERTPSTPQLTGPQPRQIPQGVKPVYRGEGQQNIRIEGPNRMYGEGWKTVPPGERVPTRPIRIEGPSQGQPQLTEPPIYGQGADTSVLRTPLRRGQVHPKRMSQAQAKAEAEAGSAHAEELGRQNFIDRLRRAAGKILD